MRMHANFMMTRHVDFSCFGSRYWPPIAERYFAICSFEGSLAIAVIPVDVQAQDSLFDAALCSVRHTARENSGGTVLSFGLTTGPRSCHA